MPGWVTSECGVGATGAMQLRGVALASHVLSGEASEASISLMPCLAWVTSWMIFTS
jgi:hypothetical protein